MFHIFVIDFKICILFHIILVVAKGMSKRFCYVLFKNRSKELSF
jgi:hypothetical protein